MVQVDPSRSVATSRARPGRFASSRAARQCAPGPRAVVAAARQRRSRRGAPASRARTMRWLLDEVDPGQGRMGVEDPNSAAEAPFHKFLAVDAAPTAWSCTAFASGLAFVQARASPASRACRAATRRRCGARRGRAAPAAAARVVRCCGAARIEMRGTCRARADAPRARCHRADIPAAQVLQLTHAAGARCATYRPLRRLCPRATRAAALTRVSPHLPAPAALHHPPAADGAHLQHHVRLRAAGGAAQGDLLRNGARLVRPSARACARGGRAR